MQTRSLGTTKPVFLVSCIVDVSGRFYMLLVNSTCLALVAPLARLQDFLVKPLYHFHFAVSTSYVGAVVAPQVSWTWPGRKYLFTREVNVASSPQPNIRGTGSVGQQQLFENVLIYLIQARSQREWQMYIMAQIIW
jgi:hypothetical protein